MIRETGKPSAGTVAPDFRSLRVQGKLDHFPFSKCRLNTQIAQRTAALFDFAEQPLADLISARKLGFAFIAVAVCFPIRTSSGTRFESVGKMELFEPKVAIPPHFHPQSNAIAGGWQRMRAAKDGAISRRKPRLHAKGSGAWQRRRWWTGLDSNQRTLARADLQSAAFNHSATCPHRGL